MIIALRQIPSLALDMRLMLSGNPAVELANSGKLLTTGGYRVKLPATDGSSVVQIRLRYSV